MIFFYICFFIVVAVLAIPTLILAYLPFSWWWVKAGFFKIVQFAYVFLFALTFLPYCYEGIDKKLPETAIFIANHESAMDIFLLGKVVGHRHHVNLAKAELLKYPVLGHLVERVGIPVYEQGHPKKGKVVEQAVEKLNQGMSVVLFPEGMRTKPGQLEPFRLGFAAMAKLSGKPVVPVYIGNTGKCFPPQARRFKHCPLFVKVGDPFVCGDNETIEAFRDRVKKWFVKQTAEYHKT